MIHGFNCKDTEKLFNDEYVGRFSSIERMARIKLDRINASEKLTDFNRPPGKRLEV